MKTPPVQPAAAARPAEDDVDPDAPPSEEELHAAAELRDALDDATREHDGATLARALVLAHAPRPLDARENEALVQQALTRGDATTSVRSIEAARARRARRLAAAGCALAFAAAMLVLQRRTAEPLASLDAPVQLHVRSSQPLFHEPFAAHGGTSARIDRIASARAGDLRENRFARWDVR